ncbi:MAG: hypothetical protein V2I33_20670 [Kangiellaceae bacterium]|nr:hypothetical protein [Kangiellaceae bacterium]
MDLQAGQDKDPGNKVSAKTANDTIPSTPKWINLGASLKVVTGNMTNIRVWIADTSTVEEDNQTAGLVWYDSASGSKSLFGTHDDLAGGYDQQFSGFIYSICIRNTSTHSGNPYAKASPCAATCTDDGLSCTNEDDECLANWNFTEYAAS